jgi:hypothetical protein
MAPQFTLIEAAMGVIKLSWLCAARMTPSVTVTVRHGACKRYNECLAKKQQKPAKNKSGGK